MKPLLPMTVMLLFLAGTSYAQELAKLNLDDNSTLGTTIQTDPEIKAEGKSSIKITAQWPTSICLGEVSNLNIENATLVYSAKVKSELHGSAYLEMWAHVGGGQYFSRGTNDTIGKVTDWKTIKTPFNFQKNQRPEKVTLNIVINGKGTVWVDDIVLSKEPLQ